MNYEALADTKLFFYDGIYTLGSSMRLSSENIPSTRVYAGRGRTAGKSIHTLEVYI